MLAADARLALWEQAESLVRDFGEMFDPSTQLAALHSLQARAVRIAFDDYGPSSPDATLRTKIEASRVRFNLRPWKESDLDRYVELLDDARVWAHLPEDYPNPLTPDLARDLIRISNDADHHRVRAIEMDGNVVGQVRITRVKRSWSPILHGEISYWLGVPYWGQGIISSVIPMYIDECFRTSTAPSFFARVAQLNVASSRALEKSGFLYVGTYFAELNNEPGIRTYRCYREHYLGEAER
jgi:RimJ/RimL family protein N-acetyltransferase